MGGKIDVYVDCSSPYSYFAVVYLRKQRELLKQYGVEYELHPVFLGGINVHTGNKPPSTLPAKAAYGPYDLKRAVTHFQTQPLSAPSWFPLFSILPQRAMLVIKSRKPREVFEEIYESLWLAVFNRHVDIAKPENLGPLLASKLDGGEEEMREILRLAGTQVFKDQLSENTKNAIERGAFGAPWFWMTNDQGVEEPCFGSDRWSYIFRFMGVQVRELEIVDRNGSTKL